MECFRDEQGRKVHLSWRAGLQFGPHPVPPATATGGRWSGEGCPTDNDHLYLSSGYDMQGEMDMI